MNVVLAACTFNIIKAFCLKEVILMVLAALTLSQQPLTSMVAVHKTVNKLHWLHANYFLVVIYLFLQRQKVCIPYF